jgi:GT2 family glycosyltransferase
MDFTVAIRTFNGAERLPALLDRLLLQVDTEGIQWEVVVVDNNSRDATAQVVAAYQARWSANSTLRYVFEPKQGAAIARRCAIEAAQGRFIGFLDDDNLPTSTWVASAYAFGQAHPQAGAFASTIQPDYEVEPPPNFDRIAIYLAIVDRRKTYRFDSRVLPPGAGLVIRRQAWLAAVPEQLVLQGPIASQMSAKGEDIESLLHLFQAGWEIWHNAEMKIIHRIPQWRLERHYLLPFFRGIGLGLHRFRMLRAPIWQRPFLTVLYGVRDSAVLLLYVLKHRHQLSHDLVTACELELLIGKSLSPLHIWKLSHSQRA